MTTILVGIVILGVALAGGEDGPRVDIRVNSSVGVSECWIHMWSPLCPVISGHAPGGFQYHEDNTSQVLWVLSTMDLRMQPHPDTPIQRTEGPQVPLSEIQSQWQSGYRAYGGKGEYEAHFILDVIPCESGWRLDPPETRGIYFGLGQWLPDTWERASRRSGLTDWLNPYHQGANFAVWSAITVPGEQWPTCWWVGE